MFKKIIAAAALATIAASSYAATPNSFYAGVDVGATNVDGFSGTKASFGGIVGYNFTQNIAVEGGYRRLASFKESGFDVDVDQAAVSAIGTLPLSNGFNVFGRLGYNRLEAKVSGYSAHDNNVLVGIGAGYDFGNKLSGRIEVQRPSSDSTNVSVGLIYSF